MAIFDLHLCYVLALILNHSIGLEIREIPAMSRARRYGLQDADRDISPYYQNSDWFNAAKRLAGDGDADKDAKPFLDLASIKDVLGLNFEAYDQQEDPEGYSEVPDQDTVLQRNDTSEDYLAPEDPEQSATDYQFRYYIQLDSKGDFKLFWDIDDILEVIHFRLVAMIKKTDLLIFGFSDYGEIQSADVIVMWTNHRGRHVVQDAHTDPDGKLHLDDSQDYVLDDVSIQDGALNLIFHRKYDTCDDDDYLIDTGTTHMVFFTNPGVVGDIENLDLSDVKVGVQRVQLIKSQLPDAEMPEDTEEFVMHVDKVKIPEDETTYWLAVRKLPDMKEKHHIIKYEGVISPQSEGVVHHMEVFHCDVAPGEKLPYFDGPNESKEGRPKGLEPCRQVIGAWAMGAQALTYPEEAGAPIGGQDYSRYVMIEVHYNNPDHKQGIIDSSGIKFYVTRRLRKYDAATMEIGQEYTDKVALPPGLTRWNLLGYCMAECTKAGLPEKGIKVFASQLHTHLTGRTTYTRHYRNGAELPNLNRDNHYSPHYQEIRKLRRHVTVLPGDVLVHVCEDETSDRENVTLGGFSISDEMCVNYMHYYPRTSLEVCKSSVTTSSLYGFFKFMNVYDHQPTSPDLGISDNYKAIDWSPLNIQLLQTYYDTAPLSVQCNQSDGQRFPGVQWEGMPVPKLFYPRPPEERPCLL